MNMMSENNRNRKQLPINLDKREARKSVHINQESQASSINESTDKASQQHNAACIEEVEMPITYCEYKQQLSKIQTDNSRQPNFIVAQERNILQELSQSYKKFTTLIDGKQSKTTVLSEQILSQLLQLHEKCINLKLFGIKKCWIKNEGQTQSNLHLQWMALLFNVSLQTWKVLSTRNDSPVSGLQLLKRTCLKIISSLQINGAKESSSYLKFLPNKLKNKLILLLIIWAKEELGAGNQDEALKICDVCSYQIIYCDSDGQNNIQRGVLISKENKFKLHYLRMRIFNSMGRERQQIQEIVVCQSILKSIINNDAIDKKNVRTDGTQQQLFEEMNQIKRKQKSNQNILKKLERRKLQILKFNQNAIKKISKSNEFKRVEFHSTLSNNQVRVKQIRDSINNGTKEQKKSSQNHYQSGFKVRSMSNGSLHKNTTELGDRNDSFMMKKTAKNNNYLSLHHSRKQKNQFPDETVQKFRNLKLRQSPVIGSNTMNSLKRAMNSMSQNNSKQIKQKYELTTKKLNKRPIILSNRNKQFEDVLTNLEVELNSNAVQQQKVVKPNIPLSVFNYAELLAKRPENKIKTGSNLRRNQNEMQKEDEYMTNQNDKKLSEDEDSGSEKQNQQRGPCISMEKIMFECIQKVESQTIDKFIQRNAGIKNRKNYEYNNLEDLNSDANESNEETQKQIVESNQSEDIEGDNFLRNTNLRQIAQSPHECKLYNKMEEKHIVQQAEPCLQLNIRNVIFPGLNLCSFKVVIKKIKQFVQNTQSKYKFSFLLNLCISSQIGNFSIVHRIQDSLMHPSFTIAQNITNRMKADLYCIRVNKELIPNYGHYTLEQEARIKVMKYIKNTFKIANKGLGVYLQQKLNKRGEIDAYCKLKYNQILSRIYLEKINTLQFIFSEQNLCHLSEYENQRVEIAALQNKQNQKIEDESNKEKDHNQRVKVMYVTIEKKSKKNKKHQQCGKNQQIKNEDSDNLKTKKQLKLDKAENPFLKHEQNNVGFSMLKMLNLSKGVLEANNSKKQEIIEKEAEIRKRLSVDNLLIPVVKYILMGETLKPKHKLKTIIIKNRDSISDLSIFSSDQESQQNMKKGKSGERKHSKQNRYGLLTPFIDDASAIKVNVFSISIYSQIIGRYFMGVDGRKHKKNSNQIQIPQDVMLSLKNYLMISNQNSDWSSDFERRVNFEDKNLNCRSNNIIERFYDKFQYSMITKLRKNQRGSGILKSYIIQIALHRVKKLYRKGLQKFYLLKFEVQQKSARSQVNHLIITSFDVQKHFGSLHQNLINLMKYQTGKIQQTPLRKANQIYLIKDQVANQKQLGNLPTVRDSSKDYSNRNEVDSSLGQNDEQSMLIFPNADNFAKSQAYDKQKNSPQLSQSYSESQIQIHSQIALESNNYQMKNKLEQAQRKQIIYSDTNSVKKASFVPIIAINDAPVTNNNRLSCPQSQVIQKLSVNSISSKNALSPFVSCFNSFRNSKSELQKQSIHEEANQIGSKYRLQPSLRIFKGESQLEVEQPKKQYKTDRFQRNVHKKMSNFRDVVINTNKSSISECLRQICQKMVIYKSLVHTKLGIQPLRNNNLISNDSNSELEDIRSQKISCYSNKFRFSRNKSMSIADQFLSPHLNCIQILFQKGIKIDCDKQFAIFTVLKIKYHTDFYIKIYVPFTQKTMSFSISHQVFNYFSKEDLFSIFSPFVQFNQAQFIEKQTQQIELRKSKLKGNGQKEIFEVLQCPESKISLDDQSITQKKEIQYLVEKIAQYFSQSKYSVNGETLTSSKFSNQHSSMKVIWNRILKYVKFQRRILRSCDDKDQNNQSYLVAHFGNYQAFIKGFSVDEYIVVKSEAYKNIEKQNLIVQIQVSIGNKVSGLNFLDESKRNRIRRKRGINRKAENHENTQKTKLLTKKEDGNIYESETNKQIVYISILNCKTNEKLCYNYYLCELLHLIDTKKDQDKSMSSQRLQGSQSQRSVYKVHSNEFHEIILNYALLFKVLNYIKNQYIIELQESQQSYFPKLYKDNKLKSKLKQNVDKILLKEHDLKEKKQNNDINNNKRHESSIRNLGNTNEQDEKPQNNNESTIFQNLLNTMLSCTLKSLKTQKTRRDEISDNEKMSNQKKALKITFNSAIKAQSNPKLSLLVRKVVQKNGYPVSCIYLDKVGKILKIYLTNCRTGLTQQVDIPVNLHPMPYIQIIIRSSTQNVNSLSETILSQDEQLKNKQNGFLLAIRDRLRRYHHNLTILTPI